MTASHYYRPMFHTSIWKRNWSVFDKHYQIGHNVRIGSLRSKQKQYAQISSSKLCIYVFIGIWHENGSLSMSVSGFKFVKWWWISCLSDPLIRSIFPTIEKCLAQTQNGINWNWSNLTRLKYWRRVYRLTAVYSSEGGR